MHYKAGDLISFDNGSMTIKATVTKTYGGWLTATNGSDQFQVHTSEPSLQLLPSKDLTRSFEVGERLIYQKGPCTVAKVFDDDSIEVTNKHGMRLRINALAQRTECEPHPEDWTRRVEEIIPVLRSWRERFTNARRDGSS